MSGRTPNYDKPLINGSVAEYPDGIQAGEGPTDSNVTLFVHGQLISHRFDAVADASGPKVQFLRSGGTNPHVTASVTADDTVMNLACLVPYSDTLAFAECANIIIDTQQASQTTATGTPASRIRFYTTPGGSNTKAEAIQIDENAQLRVVTSGITVGANASPAADTSIDLRSATQGLKLNVCATQAAVGTPAKGMLIYDDGASKLKFYTGLAWETVTST